MDGKNLSVLLVEEGLCKVLPQAERLSFGKSLFDAEEKAREAKKNLWEVNSCQPEQCTVSVVHVAFLIALDYMHNSLEHHKLLVFQSRS